MSEQVHFKAYTVIFCLVAVILFFSIYLENPELTKLYNPLTLFFNFLGIRYEDIVVGSISGLYLFATEKNLTSLLKRILLSYLRIYIQYTYKN